MTYNSKLTIDVYYDLICPWCLIGKRNLSAALEQLKSTRPDLEPRIVWHSFPLLPDTPLEGLPYQAFYERRLGGPAAVSARRAQVRDAARRAGVELNFEAIQVMPNTLAAHALVTQVAGHSDAPRTENLIEALFVAYFQQGRDIGDVEVLLAIAAECGCTVSLQQLAAASAVTGADARHDVSGVPYYVFNGRFALSGAHPPEALLAAMQRSGDRLVA